MICLQTHNLIIHFSSTREPCSDSVELRTCRGKTWWLTEILSWEFTARGALLVMLLCTLAAARIYRQQLCTQKRPSFKVVVRKVVRLPQQQQHTRRSCSSQQRCHSFPVFPGRPWTWPWGRFQKWKDNNTCNTDCDTRAAPHICGASRRAPASSGAQQQVWPSIFPITARWTSFNPRTKPLGKRQHSLPWYYNGLPDAEKPTTLIHINWYVRDTLGRTSNLLLKLKLGYFFEELATCNGDSNATLCRACCMSYVRWRWSRFLVPWLFSALVNVTGVAPSVMKYWTLLQPFSIAPPAWLKVEATSN